MGYASDVYTMLASAQDVNDVQLFFTKLFLDETARVRERMLIPRLISMDAFF